MFDNLLVNNGLCDITRLYNKLNGKYGSDLIKNNLLLITSKVWWDSHKIIDFSLNKIITKYNYSFNDERYKYSDYLDSIKSGIKTKEDIGYTIFMEKRAVYLSQSPITVEKYNSLSKDYFNCEIASKKDGVIKSKLEYTNKGYRIDNTSKMYTILYNMYNDEETRKIYLAEQ